MTVNRFEFVEQEDWDDGDGKITQGECHRCGEIRKVKHTTDPYLDEIDGAEPDYVPEFKDWCGPCWLQRKEEV